MSTTTPTTTAAAPEQVLAHVRPARGLWSDAWRRLRRNKMAMVGLVYLAFLAIVAIFAPAIAPHNPVKTDVRDAGVYRQAAWIHDPNPMRTGKWDYPLGTDSVGRDVFSRLIYGTRVSLIVGFIPMFFTLLLGVLIGTAAGYLGRRVDNFLMRVTDVVYAFPALLFFIIMQVAF
ncbi:MAG: ABC transporter permease, partial [Thermomicrobiaceae bacterium]|nr:ABC transporter permease [Thermomicrobiaceae bacterium]